jgi:hypothetical protein
LLVGTVHGTLSFFNYSFLELGVDAGFLTSEKVKAANPGMGMYSSVYPFVHYNAGYINETLALYAGLGGGYAFTTYAYGSGNRRQDMVTLDALAGFWFHGFDISVTARTGTDFSGINIKTSAGYSWRFK